MPHRARVRVCIRYHLFGEREEAVAGLRNGGSAMLQAAVRAHRLMIGTYVAQDLLQGSALDRLFVS